MCAQVVEIGDFKIKREQRMKLEGCEHKHLTLHDEGGIATCDDCEKQVDNYAALRMLVERWALLQDRVDRQREAIADTANKTLSLRAAHRVEKAWRSRSMVPTCPHCSKAVFAEDGFGGSMVSKEIAVRRRDVRKQNTTEPSAP